MNASTGRGPITNILTVDVEDYYQVSAFESIVARDRWIDYESRVEASTGRLLDLFAEMRVQATFFVLGWIADRYPRLVRRVAEAGHEVASHGFWHRLVYEMTPAEFRDDLRQAKAAIETASGRPVIGFRAPSFSITERSLWALDVLAEEGYRYDASIYPIHHDRYGMANAPRHPHWITRNGVKLLEVPGATLRLPGVNLPIGGGGYFRFFPYRLTRMAINRINVRERLPVSFYLHPWEVDPGQPRLSAPLLSRFRHYRNLRRTEARLRRLLADFRFAGIARALLEPTRQAGEVK